MGHYDCDDCGNFDCECKRAIDNYENTFKYHVVSLQAQADYVRIFVSHYWGPESLKRNIERKYFNIPGEVFRKQGPINLYEDPATILKEIL